MTTLINKESTQHYANKMVLAENRKVGSKSLPAALNEIDALIDEMKTYFEEEYNTPLETKLSNIKNTFSVGTSSKIDKRNELENSFTNVEINGKSLVNLCPLAKETTVVRTKAVTFQPPMKANTTYTLISSISNSNFDSGQWGAIISIAYPTLSPDFIALGGGSASSIVNGYKIQKFTTKAEPVKNFQFAVHSVNSYTETNKFILDYAIILEGDHTQNPPEYFEGLKSIGENQNNKIDILSCNGGNIISNPRYKRGYFVDYRNGNEREEVTYSCTDYIEIEPNREIRVVNTNFNIVFYDSNKNYIKRTLQDFIGTNTDFKTITPSNASYVRFSTANKAIGTEGCFYGDSIGDINTEIRIDKKEISLNEPLRRIPNGVKDTIEMINGQWKIVRRCKEVLLNGKEYWHYSGDHTSNEDYKCFHSQISTEHKIGVNNVGLSDKFPIAIITPATAFEEGIQPSANYNVFYVKVKANKVEGTNNANIFRTWVTNNPIRVIYQLATPIIEDIDPITLQCWKNGVISIGEVLPVETNHTVALNKSAQIKNNIEELTTLRKRVEALESFYDKIALEQAYQLDLVNYSYELDYNR